MKSLLIMNPTAGRPKPDDIVERIDRALHKHGLPCDIALTEKSGDGTALAQQAVRERCNLVIAAGGDGTVKEVVNGLVGTQTKLGILPIGTVNVLARELKIPFDTPKAIQVLAEGNTNNIDLGCANGHYFTLMAGLGFDGEVVSNVLQPLKDIIGSSAYVLSAIETLVKYDPTEVTLEMPDGTYTTEAFLVIVANSSTYAYKLKMAPYATPDDGLLDICVFERSFSDKIGFVRQVAEIFINRHVYHKAVSYWKTPKVTIKSNPNVLVQLDGDSFDSTPVDISICPRILSVIVPPKR